MLWLPMAFLSALFTGITAILWPSAASAPRAQPQPPRTGLVLVFSWLMVLGKTSPAGLGLMVPGALIIPF